MGIQQLASQINNKVTTHHSRVTACRRILPSPSASSKFICIALEGLYTHRILLKPSHAKLLVEYPISVKEQREGNAVLLQPFQTTLSCTTVYNNNLTPELLKVLLCHYTLHMYISWTSKVKLERNKECELRFLPETFEIDNLF